MGNNNRNLFRLTRFILLKLPRLLRFFSRYRSPQKRLLIIKTDAIGDYILFRNYLEVLRQSEKYKDFHITLLGNEPWKELALTYDADFVNDFIFIRPDELYHAPLQTLRLGWRLFKNNYKVVLLPSSTRVFITDGLAGLTAAKQIIGFESDNEGIAEKYKLKTDKYYTLRLHLPQHIFFEFERSKYFFEQVLGAPVSLSLPFIPFGRTAKKGILIFPGAGNKKRGWEAGKFLDLIKLILEHTPHHVYLSGGVDDIDTGNCLAANLPPERVTNLTGKTSLPQLVQLIGNSALVIANETSAIHIAAATQTPSVCVLGGGHFGRFAPYPLTSTGQHANVFEKMECYNCNWQCKFKSTENEYFPCISTISVENVSQAVFKQLTTINID